MKDLEHNGLYIALSVRVSRDKCQYLERKRVFPMDGGVSVLLMSLRLIAGTCCDEWL